MRRWLIVADAAEARLLRLAPDGKSVSLIQEFKHPRGRSRTQEINSDRPGRLTKGKGTRVRSAMESRTDTHTVQMQQFAVEIAAAMQAAHGRHEFDQLAVIAPPRFLGILRRELDAHGATYPHVGLTRNFTKIELKDLPTSIRPAMAGWFKPAAKRVKSIGSPGSIQPDRRDVRMLAG